jgi:hypothetical protein
MEYGNKMLKAWEFRHHGKGDSRFMFCRNGGVACSKRCARGSVMTEYVFCALLMMLVLFVPYGDEPSSAVDKLMEAIRESHAARVHAIGNPVVGSSKSFSK